jgi:hypothetical protein
VPRLHSAPAAATLPSQVSIHYPRSASEAAAAAADALRAAAVPEVEIVPIPYAIGRSNIRYYHDGDRAPAAALAPLLAAPLGGPAPEVRDFTGYATPAALGNVEIWLAGDPGVSASPAPAHNAPNAPQRLRAATPAAKPAFQMPGVIAPAPTRAEQVERILVERLRQRR